MLTYLFEGLMPGLFIKEEHNASARVLLPFSLNDTSSFID